MANPDTRAGVWSRFWRHGTLHSLSDSFTGNYEGEIRAFWQDEFARLGPGLAMLDVGTGNGPLPALACELLPGRMPRIDAIDLATPSPAWLAGATPDCRAAVRFHSGVAAEALPFADASFDLVASQFGIEYADLRAALCEAVRVLTPGGRIALVVHHAGSRLAEVAGEETAHVEHLLGAGGIMQAADAILAPLARVARGEADAVASDATATAARRAYNDAMRAVGAAADASTVPDLLLEAREFVAGQAEAVLRGKPEADARLDHARYVQALRDTAFRHVELRRHALDADALAAVAATLHAAGMATRHAPLHHDGMLVAWSIQAWRQAPA